MKGEWRGARRGGRGGWAEGNLRIREVKEGLVGDVVGRGEEVHDGKLVGHDQAGKERQLQGFLAEEDLERQSSFAATDENS